MAQRSETGNRKPAIGGKVHGAECRVFRVESWNRSNSCR